MAQATLTREAETQQIQKDYSHIYRYLRGILLVGIGIWLGMTLFSDADGYWTNIFTEGVGIVATYFIFDEITKRSAKREQKEQLLAELKSPSVAPAVNALDRLRREEWIDDNYFVGKDLHRANWEGAYIGGLNFEGANLGLVNFKGVTVFDGANHQGANFKGAYLVGVQLEGAYLSGTQLEGADLLGAKLKGAHLREAQLEGANLWGAQLEGALLVGAQLEGANLNYVQLEGASLVGAQLKGADLSEAHLEGACLDRAHLEGASLSEAQLKGADLSGTHLEGANLSGAHLEKVTWTLGDVKYPAILPDGTPWSPEEEMKRFTDVKHPDYRATLEKINAIRQEQGHEPIRYRK